MKYPEKKFSELLNNSIYDSSGEKIGKLIDAVFDLKEGNIVLCKLIVGGSAIEEFLEKIKIKKDIDPVFHIDSIKKFDDYRINLRKKGEELKSTEIHDDAILDHEIKFSHLRKFKVVDPTGSKIGSLIDIRFQKNQVEFILGDGFFRELLEDVGLVDDLDFIIAPEFVEKLDLDKKEIHLNKNKDELETLLTEFTRSHEAYSSIYLHQHYVM